jgi:LacI family transcriptional regulator
MRAEQFVGQLRERGYAASVFRCSPLSKHAGLAAIEAHVARHSDDLAQWLHDLPKPVALMACNDMRGYHVISTCGARGIAVPDEIAVLGVDNDEVQCELCDPPLTSIDPEPARMGYEAAAMLHRMIRGETVPSTRLLAKPVKVVTRSSTGVLAIADRNVADAVRLLREHACQGTEFRQICAELSLSPSTLNRWCHKWLGRSPMAEITRVRIERVHELLTTTNLPLEAIAHLSGFRHVESVCRMMKRMSGKTAGEYRRQAGTLDRL